MNEIEKLYENVGIEPIVRDNAIGRGYYIEHQRVEEYPPFTAEKQLKLIVFFVRKGFKVSFDNYTRDFSLEGIQKSIAMAINGKWQDLTSEEKEQIRNILEG